MAAQNKALDVLLAEDNLVNQQLVARMLSTRGHRVVVVDDGRKAVDAMEKGTFDVVLMDIEMPEMDGLTATRTIREGLSSDVPIVALTAHLGATERQACLDAGMNGVLSKPFKPADLFAVVEGSAVHTEEVVSPAEAMPVDLEGLAEDLHAGGIGDMQALIVETFVNDAPRKVAAVHEALASGDMEALRKAAHAYKSSSGTIHALALAQSLLEVEQAAARGGAEGIGALVDAVAKEHGRVVAFLKTVSV